ncbi:SRPBCC domain-containing protein [uncultured Croceitalea sp.]|uniref:SRPBCC family protein n=1 Tax=uncultured Croceitalea sp. TaxID=1798908 RepID=UPI0033062001
MSKKIKWHIHFKTSPQKVYHYLATQEGRERFWAKAAPQVDGYIHFVFANDQVYKSEVLTSIPCSSFKIEYFDSVVTFILKEDGHGGTDLTVFNTDVPEKEYAESYPGWVSWLMTLKAAVDFQVDLRNHDSTRTWDQGYVDN